MAKKLVTRPVEPTEDGSVVRWTKWDGYTFASILTPQGLWYTTQDPRRSGNQRIFPLTWDALLDKIGEKNWGSIELLD